MINKFKQRLQTFEDNDEVIKRLSECKEQQFASPYWLSEAMLNLDGLHKLAEEMMQHIEGEAK
jgi:hypothetical protein